MMVAVEYKSKSGEIFPFSNWSLFSSISSLETVPALRLHSINGRTLPSPRLYFDMGETFVLARQRDVNCWKTVLALVFALRADDKEKVGRMRRLIEQRYMAEADSAEYDIAILCLFAVAISNSRGGIDHAFHIWLWIGICLVFLPSVRSAGALSRTVKMTYLSVIVAVQALILLFYTLAGFWKVKGGLSPLLHGIEGNFSPRGLALQLADRILETGTKPLLADFVITNYWLIWPMFLALLYVQLVAVLVVLRPRLHIVWAHILILFHIGTWVLMEIDFPQHVLFLGLLFAMSPFRPRQWNFREVLSDLPGFGLLVRLFWPTPEIGSTSAQKNVEVTPEAKSVVNVTFE